MGVQTVKVTCYTSSPLYLHSPIPSDLNKRSVLFFWSKQCKDQAAEDIIDYLYQLWTTFCSVFVVLFTWTADLGQTIKQ